MQSRLSKSLFVSALLSICLSSSPLLANGSSSSDSLAEASRGEFVAASLQNVKGEHQGAVEHYRKLLGAQPSNAAIHYALSKAYVALGVLDSARVHSEKSVQLNPDNKYYKELLAGISYQLTNYRQVADRYRQLATLGHGAGKERPLFTLGQLYQQTGQHDLAIKTFRELLHDNPRVLPAWLALFEASVQSGNYIAFAEDLAQFHKSSQATLDQKTDLARLFVIRASKDRAYVDPAYLMIASLRKYHPGDSRLLLNLELLKGELLFQTGHTRKAMLLLEKIVRSKNAKKERVLFLEAKSTLALCYDKLGAFDKCIRLYKSILLLEPGNTLMMNNLAYIFAQRGKELPRARELAMQAVAREPANASYLDTFGWVFFKMGEYENARETLEKAARLNNDEAEIFEHLSKVYEKLGNSRKALEMQERASKLK